MFDRVLNTPLILLNVSLEFSEKMFFQKQLTFRNNKTITIISVI